MVPLGVITLKIYKNIILSRLDVRKLKLTTSKYINKISLHYYVLIFKLF
jgi:hypothetical protein